MANDELIAALRDAEAVRFGEFELSHGGTSDYYVDKYVFETDPRCLDLIATAFAERLAADEEGGAARGTNGAAADGTNGAAADGSESAPKLAGVALGAVPLVAATSVATGRPYVIVRKRRKEYGTGNLIEGDLDDGEEVVVLEDIATTGRSAVDAAEALREAGATVERVLVVVDREEGARANLADADLELESLVTASELLAAADRE